MRKTQIITILLMPLMVLGQKYEYKKIDNYIKKARQEKKYAYSQLFYTDYFVGFQDWLTTTCYPTETAHYIEKHTKDSLINVRLLSYYMLYRLGRFGKEKTSFKQKKQTTLTILQGTRDSIQSVRYRCFDMLSFQFLTERVSLDETVILSLKNTIRKYPLESSQIPLMISSYNHPILKQFFQDVYFEDNGNYKKAYKNNRVRMEYRIHIALSRMGRQNSIDWLFKDGIKEENLYKKYSKIEQLLKKYPSDKWMNYYYELMMSKEVETIIEHPLDRNRKRYLAGVLRLDPILIIKNPYSKEEQEEKESLDKETISKSYTIKVQKKYLDFRRRYLKRVKGYWQFYDNKE